MTTISPQLTFFLSLAKVQAILDRRFDAGLNGLGLTEFMILLYLSRAKGEKLRRSDLAEKIGLTASGVTRLLAPMEKIGLIRREANPHDARVSEVALAPGGKTKLQDSMDYATVLSEDLLPAPKRQHLETTLEMLEGLGGLVA